MNYFIIVNDTQQGPFTVAELQQRGIASDTLVWTEGMEAWTPAWQVDELRPLFYNQTAGTQMPPPPPVTPTPPTPPTASTATGATIVEPVKRRHYGRWLLAALALVLLVLAFTNPSEEKHRQVVCANVTNGISKAMGGDADNLLSQGLGFFGSMIGGSVVEMVLDQSLEYHNYIFFSTTTLRVGQTDVPASTGFLGKVFTAGEDQVAKGIGKALQQGDAFGDAVDDDGAHAGQDVQVQRSERDTTFTDEAGRAIGRAVMRQVTKTVKQKVSENTDSATSDGIGKIIDGLEKLIGE